MRKATMRDVSEATGFSMFTVSRALNGGDGVADDSRELILKVARELGYVPNRAAQALRRSSRDSVAVITAHASNSYYLNLMSGIQHMLQPSQWTVVLGDIAVNGIYDRTQEDRMINRLIESRMAGIISTVTLHPESLSLLAKWDIPVVFVDSPPRGDHNFPSVTTDNYHASLLVGEHLAQHEYKNWLLLIYPERWTTRFERERGIRESAECCGATLRVLETENDAHSASEKLSQYLDSQAQLPDVLIAGNNPILLGSLQQLQQRQIAIPDDIALIGYDEFDWAPLLNPPLTVLNENSEEIGKQAAEMLIRLIKEEGKGDTTTQLRVPAELVVRQSCGCSKTNKK
ncbi:LacI family DNA-binding transcriptional regulator [Klebsiella sp. RHBSTW-00484]|uniref:LacI family DNA-binding transcriptional regulator n=1 Tax=unclassified Klebsiella TaxID=2608929 RepID=UPI0015E52B0B|nr:MULTISPECIES: LacI family DNA-binding transcriptional regulator [unclassified Klebsiella]MBA7847099.1 LacI family DNA-binding transcriptional regulator [Klebsiella sp. RHBSTW-00465]QLO36997.1 LacI family DNA-binding transcriptional regulator [Klebsiella sp. RHBSTW-00484]QLT76515.1 LacI family DNA-binding transcriptional regulator [Klebsiella sp. RHBSTW-00464]